MDASFCRHSLEDCTTFWAERSEDRPGVGADVSRMDSRPVLVAGNAGRWKVYAYTGMSIGGQVRRIHASGT